MEKDKKQSVNDKPAAAKKVSRPFAHKFRSANKFGRRADKPVEEFEQKIVDLARVTRVMAGGKRMKFRACMVIGNKKGKVGIGLAKGADVAMAVSKAVTQAKRNLIEVPIIDGTIPHKIDVKLKASRLMIKPARKGSGIKAGGVVRIVLELSGLKDVVAKILGANNKINNAAATIKALQSFVSSNNLPKKTVEPEDKKNK